MPVIVGKTVATGYDTAGNGGRKLVRLRNGWLVGGTKETTNVRLYVSKDNGATFQAYATCSYSSAVVDFALVTKGNVVYVLCSMGTTYITSTRVDSTGARLALPDVDSGQASVGNVSLAINELGTKLYAAWSSKSTSQPNSFNIRFAEGTINADGSVLWSAVTKITNSNISTENFMSPVVVSANNLPVIIAEYKTGNSYFIECFYSVSNQWLNPTIFSGGANPQLRPSAMFVPKTVNGLAGGLLCVAWEEGMSTGGARVGYSISENGGSIWEKFTLPSASCSGPPTITANKKGYPIVVFRHSSFNLYRISSADVYGSGWVNPVQLGSSDANSPNALLDFSLDIKDTPLIIYRDYIASTYRVKFSGSWIIINISVPEGEIGSKTDSSNVFTYNITTDDSMDSVKEYINGELINTLESLASGEARTIVLSEEQWNEIPYGKYNATSANTILIEMNGYKWSYRFDKALSENADLISVTKAIQDNSNFAMPAKKRLLGAAIRDKGGSIADTDSLEAMANAIRNL